jgi:hypothetical protein
VLQRFKLPSHVEEEIRMKERGGSVVLEASADNTTLVTPITSYEQAIQALRKGAPAQARAGGLTRGVLQAIARVRSEPRSSTPAHHVPIPS